MTKVRVKHTWLILGKYLKSKRCFVVERRSRRIHDVSAYRRLMTAQRPTTECCERIRSPDEHAYPGLPRPFTKEYHRVPATVRNSAVTRFVLKHETTLEKIKDVPESETRSKVKLDRRLNETTRERRDRVDFDPEIRNVSPEP